MRYLICLYINVIKYKIQIAVTMYITGCISFTFPEISFISTYTGIAIQIPFAMLFANIVKPIHKNAGIYSVISE